LRSRVASPHARFDEREIDKEERMSKYFVQGTYTAEGIKGLLKEGGTARKEAIDKLAGSLGGTVESLHYSATSPTYVLLMTLPEKGSAAVLSATVIASGAVTVDQCVEILTPVQMDAAAKQSVTYRPPGR
jgi:uncharacterized protein with GYD domain